MEKNRIVTQSVTRLTQSDRQRPQLSLRKTTSGEEHVIAGSRKGRAEASARTRGHVNRGVG